MRIVAGALSPVSGFPLFAILAAVEVYVQYQTDVPVYYSGRSSTDDVKAQGHSTSMEHWHRFETARSVIQIHETSIVDSESDLSAHLVTVPARSLGGDSYLFRGTDWPLETLGLVRLADVPLGAVARSLAACLVSEDVEEFLRRFHEGFKEETRHSSTELPRHFVFAEYLTFARVVPFEWSSLSADSLGNILTAQGHGEAGYMYHEGTRNPMLGVAIPAGMVICGSGPGMIRALESGLRQRLVELAKSRSTEGRSEDEHS
jgi:hypothetical protein